jgi:cobyrinic acid a,c-diamide synthase
VKIPILVVAAPASGTGKTSVTLGLVAAWRAAGYRVQTFKVGPDFLDPTYLALASGRPCYNLDGWMAGHDAVCALVRRTCADADIAVVEGVMGLFDGASPDTLEGSTAEIAAWLGAPVLLVANAHGASRTFAAVVHGLHSFLPEVRIAGVIANRCGSVRHQEGLSISLKAAGLPPLVGAIPRDGLPPLPARHLGLVSALFHPQAADAIAELGKAVAGSVELGRLLRLAQEAAGGLPDKVGESEVTSAIASDRTNRTAAPLRLAVAWDAAFHFYYPDHLEALEAEGCEVVRFSPLHDKSLPEGIAGIYLGGGYPEARALELSANTAMLQALRDWAAHGGVIYAECGGLMYLTRSLQTLEGEVVPLCGILPVETVMENRRQMLGYVEVELQHSTLWGGKGERLRGHEFHYSRLVRSPAEQGAWQVVYALHYRRQSPDKPTQPEGWFSQNILASYVHLHFASHPQAVRRFVQALREPPATN